MRQAVDIFASWFADWQRRRSARKRAICFFERSSGHRAIRSMVSVIAEQPDRVVVRVCHGLGNIPPRRAWFAVPDDGSEIAELSWEEANRLGEPPWR